MFLVLKTDRYDGRVCVWHVLLCLLLVLTAELARATWSRVTRALEVAKIAHHVDCVRLVTRCACLVDVGFFFHISLRGDSSGK